MTEIANQALVQGTLFSFGWWLFFHMVHILSAIEFDLERVNWANLFPTDWGHWIWLVDPGGPSAGITRPKQHEKKPERLVFVLNLVKSCLAVRYTNDITWFQFKIGSGNSCLIDILNNSKLGENSVLSKPGTPSGPGHCHHLENWDKINCRWGQCFLQSTPCSTCTNKIDSLNDFTHRFMIPGMPYVWKGVSFCQAISGCPPVMSVCVCVRTYKQVVNTLTHPRSCSSCLSALAASFYWQLLADADMLCARIPISRMCSLAALMLALKHTEAVPVAFASIVVISAFRHQYESSPPNQMRQQGGVLRCPSRWCVRQHWQSLAHVSEWRKCKINTMDNADICGLNSCDFVLRVEWFCFI